MAADISGSGPAVLLIHGITESRRMWDPLVPALAETHTVLSVDLPGHGEAPPAKSYDVVSMAGAVAAEAEKAGLDVPLVIGHSLGGVVATAYAAFHPSRGVVNIDQPLHLSGFQAALKQIEPALRGDEATFQATIDAVFETFWGQLQGADRDRIAALRHARQDVVLAIWGPVLDSSPADLDALVASLASGVDVPYLALHGIDPGPDYAAWLEELIPGAEVELWPDVGHYPHLVDPKRFLARLADFEEEL